MPKIVRRRLGRHRAIERGRVVRGGLSPQRLLVPAHGKAGVGLTCLRGIRRHQEQDEILLGAAFGRLVGDAGAVIGVVFHQVQTTRTDLETGKTDFSTKRVPRLFVGFDLRM